MADFYGVLWRPTARIASPPVPTELHKNLPQNASSSTCMCVRLKYESLFCDIEYFSIEEMRLYCIRGRGRNGKIDQSERRTKPSRGQREREKPLVYFSKLNREIKKMLVPEQTFDFMKNMNPQQLVDFLLPKDDDWHVKTSSGNASVWKAITVLCGCLSLFYVVSSLCVVVTSLHFVVSSLCLVMQS